MGTCKVCGKTGLISTFISVCRKCILEQSDMVKKILEEAHKKSREKFGLPYPIPKDPNGVKCGICGNECVIGDGKFGFCGLVKNEGGKLIRLAGTADKGLLEWYYDPHVTNCVASWVCPAGTGCGYPKYAKSRGPEIGYFNLAVFYGACNFNCLFCQNWHFKELTKNLSPLVSAKDLAEKVDKRVTCICFFGGDPGPQILHAIETSKIALRKKKGDILRVCLETNGNLNPKLLEEFAELAFHSGGVIKFDLKCFEEKLSFALSGVSNRNTCKNFKMLAKMHRDRPKVPFLHASTLLIPGYVMQDEVDKISKFIAKLDPSIPYSLLAFWPTFMMSDLPLVKREDAEECLRIAKENGLERVRIGNLHLLV